MTTLTEALKTAFVSYSTNNLREIGRYTKDRTVRATAYVLVSQFLRRAASNAVLAKCIDRLRPLNAPLRVLDLTPDQDDWKDAMFELAQWADEQSYVLYLAMFNGQMFSVGRTEEDAIQRALDAQDSHGETVDRDKIQILTVSGDKWTVQTWIDRVCYAFVVKQLDGEQ